MNQKRQRLALMTAALLLACLGCSYKIQTRERAFHFTYQVAVPTIKDEGLSVALWVPVPPTNRHQTISNVTFDSPFTVTMHTEPVYGNRMAYVSATSPLPDGLSLTLSFDVLRKERGVCPASLSEDDVELYLKPTSKVPRDHRFDEIARTVMASNKSVLENGRTLYNYILDRMTYDKSGEGWGRGDAIYACDIGKGNCTDFHSFFNAVARTADIPARFLIGFPIPREEDGMIGGYHCWAEFYAPERGWVPVDISEADKQPKLEDYLFGNLDPDRVYFTMGRDIELVPRSKAGPVNFFIYPVLEINGERSDNYMKSFSYKTLRR